MLSISQELSALDQWLEDPLIHHEQENSTDFFINRETSGSMDQYLHDYRKIPGENRGFEGFNGGDDGGNETRKKKISHNASERDRRKRINSLYSELRSLLPAEDLSKKLSIPTTVSRVVKYIPQLQREVEELLQKKKNLISNISSREDEDLSMDFKKVVRSSFSAISADQISDKEIVVQISMPHVEKGSFCRALTHLEMEGFLVISASWFESFGGRVFCNLHLQAPGNQVKDAEMLKEKILSFFEKGEGILV